MKLTSQVSEAHGHPYGKTATLQNYRIMQLTTILYCKCSDKHVHPVSINKLPTQISDLCVCGDDEKLGLCKLKISTEPSPLPLDIATLTASNHGKRQTSRRLTIWCLQVIFLIISLLSTCWPSRDNTKGKGG